MCCMLWFIRTIIGELYYKSFKKCIRTFATCEFFVTEIQFMIIYYNNKYVSCL
jgi:hypothetical protein